MKIIALPLILFLIILCGCIDHNNQEMPNIILVMADDLGWGDVNYNGNGKVLTPHLDEMARSGVIFDQFYSAAPVCSPTRASCLTGKHPYRVGIPWAGEGHLPTEELTIAEVLRSAGYSTGHFGKWHLGGLSKTIKQSYFPGEPTEYSPPWENGFDVCFSTESMMPTYNPYYHVGGDYGTPEYQFIQDTAVAFNQRSGGFRWRDFYWEGPGQIVDEWLGGDDSKIIMDRALSFIESEVKKKNQFFSVIWFHTPHTPVVAGNENRALYSDLNDIQEQHWYGAITAMDRQIGRLRNQLKEWEESNNTILWFCSDNGPSYIHQYNSAGPYRGKKAELLEGGIRVPAIIEWPNQITEPNKLRTPVVTSDFMPTLLEITNIEIENTPAFDGENILPLIMGNSDKRINPIGFRSPLPARLKKDKKADEEQFAFIDNRFKLISSDNGVSYQLYDLDNDPSEKHDVSIEFPEVKNRLLTDLLQWSASLR